MRTLAGPVLFVLLLLFAGMMTASAATYNVTDMSSLSAALADAMSGDSIVFANGITLTGNLPTLQQNITIEGNGFTLDGASLYQGFFAASGSCTIQNLTIQNTVATGYNGGNACGGGMGAGGGLFVSNLATVTINNVIFVNNSAAGGAGGNNTTSGSGGAFELGDSYLTGGSGYGSQLGGTGLGAYGATGAAASGYVGQSFVTYFGTPGASPSGATGGNGGNGATGPNYNYYYSSGFNHYYVYVAANGGAGGNGGAGNFGGGGGNGGNGGYAAYASSGGAFGGPGGTGGLGGFGGGGGMGGYGGSSGAGSGLGGTGGTGGAGGYGGGGGGGGGSTATAGGGGNGGFGGGAAGATGGGGGVALGGAIFIMQGGSLTIEGDTSISNAIVTPGASGGTGTTPGSAAGTGIFMQGSGNFTFAPAAGTITAIHDEMTDGIGSGITGAASTDRWSLTMGGAGTLFVDSPTYYSGGTIITNGVVQVSGGGTLGSGAITVSGSGALVPDNTAALPDATFNSGGLLDDDNGVIHAATFSNLTLNPGSTTYMELTSSGNNDTIAATGIMTLGGTLQVALINGYSPALGDSFTLFPSGGAINGTFSTVELPPLGPGLAWDTSQLYTTGTIAVMVAPTTISVQATQPAANAFYLTPGQFTVTRTGNTSASVSVSYTLAGTAVGGADYQLLTDTVTIPSGQTSATIAVTPIANTQATSNPTVLLTLSSATDYAIGSSSSDSVTIQEPTPYQAWKLNDFGVNAATSSDAADTADPNHNGVPNLLEYAFASDPLQTGTEPQPVVSLSDAAGEEYLALTYTQINTDPSLTYTVQVTSDLAQQTDTWHSGSSYTTVLSQVTNGNKSQITVRDNISVSQAKSRFIRIQVIKN